MVSETVDRDFVRNSQLAIVTAPGRAGLESYAGAVHDVAGVTGAEVTARAGDVARVTVTYQADPIGEHARDLVSRLHDVPPPPGGEVLVGGLTAQLADQLDTIAGLLSWMLLFLAFGSVVLPIKAIIMNILSLGASFGALV